MHIRNLISVSIALSFLVGISTARAEGSADNGSIVAAINNLVAGYGQKMTGTDQNMMLAPSPSIGFAKAYGQVQNNLKNNNTTFAPEIGITNQQLSATYLGQSTLATILSATTTTIGKTQQAIDAAVCNSASPGNPTGFSIGNFFNIGGTTSTCTQQDYFSTNQNTMQNYDARSLLGPVGYADQNATQAALNYVQFATGLTIPFPADIETLRGYKSPAFLNYLMQVRTLAAQISIGASNLLYSVAIRQRVPGLGQQAGLSTDSNAPASLLEVEAFAANRRVTSQDWYNAMENASPATIARETLYVLAEMRKEQFETRLLLERLIDTNSVIQLQMSSLITTLGLPQVKSTVQNQ